MPDEAIPGATSSTYDITEDDVGRELYCKVTATNAYGSGSADSNTIGPIEEASGLAPATKLSSP